MKTRISAIAMAFAASTLTLSPAMAAVGDEDRRASVSYTDLNLATEEGIEELDRRIDHAARQVCLYNEHRTGTRIRSREVRECYEEAKNAFDQQFAAIISEANYGG